MMQSFLSCFACGDKSNNNVVYAAINIRRSHPKVFNPVQSKFSLTMKAICIWASYSLRKNDDNKSKISMTTVTFLTSEATAPSKSDDDDEEIRRRIETLRKKDLPERKAMESEFVRQNLVRSSTVYLIEKTWSEEYTKFLKTHKLTNMPPINNEKLIDIKGQLRLNAREKEDYFIITEKIWKFVHGLYGGGPTIPKDSAFPVISIVSKKVCLLPVGIQNPLNLCFMISVIQMLLSIEHLNGYILKKSYCETNESKKKITHINLYKLLKQYSDIQSQAQPRSVLTLTDFSSTFESRFTPSMQHDAHQFLLHITQLLQEQMKCDLPPLPPTKPALPSSEYAYSNYFRQHRSIIDKIFIGQQQTTVHCSLCDHKSKTDLPFLEIVLNIVGMRTIEECLDDYYNSEKLQDLYECENCKKKSKAIKSTCITKTPNYLIIVLSKFAITTLKKVEDRVEYRKELSLKNHCYGHSGEPTYSLQSLIIHKGSKRNKGHYFTLSRRGKDWFIFNDSVVKQIEEKDSIGRDPYILVYERVRLGAS